MSTTVIEPTLNYADSASAILGALRNERDRQIVAQRYGLGLPKRYTLEKIGSDFGITRERVRQIEKAATAKLKQSQAPELRQVDTILQSQLTDRGQVVRLKDLADDLGA